MRPLAALDYAERAAQMLPDDVIIRSNLASLLAQADRPDEAAPHAAYAGRLAPGESLGVYMPLAAAYLRSNEPERLRPAIDALNEAIARRPADGYSRGLLSVAFGRTGDPGTAAQQLEHALRLLGNDEEDAIELALWLELDRRYEDALRVLEDLEVRTGGQRLSTTYAHVGEALLRAGDAELAVRAFEGAVASAEGAAAPSTAEYRARLQHARDMLAKATPAAGSPP